MNRKLFGSLLVLCLLLGLLSAVPVGAQEQDAAAQPEATPDDELVILESNGRIAVRDYPSGATLWTSPGSGFQQVATGDFNGDGSAEIIGLRGGEARVFDPNKRPGEPNAEFTFTAVPGYVWQLVTTGDFQADGRDDLVLAQSSGSGGTAQRIQSFSFPASVNGWRQTSNAEYGAPFRQLVTGDINGDRQDEVVGIRNVGSSHLLIIWRATTNPWTVLFQNDQYGFPWLAVAAANVVNDSANKAEIITTRSETGGQIASYYVFRWLGLQDLQDVDSAKYFPEFPNIAAGDVNGSGDNEVFLLRPGVTGNTPIVALTNRNYGGDPAITFNELTGQTQWRSLRTGDFDGDGRAELAVMSFNQYLIYTEPATSLATLAFPGSFIDSNFAVGDIDGPAPGPVLNVSPTKVTVVLQPGQSATRPVSITNTGAGSLSWTAAVTQGGSWLSVSPPSGTAPATLTLSINSSGLAPGVYTGQVRVSGVGTVAGSPKNIAVTLAIPTGSSFRYLPYVPVRGR